VKLPRSSIAMLMVTVGIVALNMAEGREIYQFVPWRLAGIFLSRAVLRVGLYCLICSRGRPSCVDRSWESASGSRWYFIWFSWRATGSSGSFP
jgi:hypothetical protein